MSELSLHACISDKDQRLVERALRAVERQFLCADAAPEFTSSTLALNYLRLQLWEQDREHFLVLFLNNQHQLIATEKLFSGDLNHVEVHPRIIARKALLYNAPAILIAHNHPSGIVCPSEADKRVTGRIKDVLSMLEIRLLDHIIIGADGNYWSFSEHAQL
ncbi:JAB domain-containing protein [Buttiauxella selenatireducens]|uniref:JAB domain-containing protein n=1 Tax=Buttiauxella selenatireducens TaxID=3073902 RepID=A0ABY9S4N6_9ENTR|nr:JAB domain-containing protein [Buttiauxella sp. R73]WMY72460.1 JAB domain-containing protein [Buttiauxella sp. R73]